MNPMPKHLINALHDPEPPYSQVSAEERGHVFSEVRRAAFIHGGDTNNYTR